LGHAERRHFELDPAVARAGHRLGFERLNPYRVRLGTPVEAEVADAQERALALDVFGLDAAFEEDLVLRRHLHGRLGRPDDGFVGFVGDAERSALAVAFFAVPDLHRRPRPEAGRIVVAVDLHAGVEAAEAQRQA